MLVRALSISVALACASHTYAQNWSNSGGNAARNCLSSEIGPDANDPLWSGAPSSIISWNPAIDGDRVFSIRQTSFPPESTGSPIVAFNIDTGAVLWTRHIPAVSGDWSTWVVGARDSRVYASRAGNGASVSSPMLCLDASNGQTIWSTAPNTIDAGPYDGANFATNGDIIICSFRTIKRFRAADGTLAWSANRLGSVSGSCGGALFGDAIYVADAAPGGTVIKRYNLTTGAFQYQSPVLIGFTIQQHPFVSPDGTLYVARTQNNLNTDFFYALDDTGSALTIRWSIPSQWSTNGEYGVGPDNSVYMMAPGGMLTRRNPTDGSLMNSYGPIAADFLSPHFAIDAAGKVFFSNGAFSNGMLYAFNADLSFRWSLSVPNANIGGPALGRDGTLIMSGSGTNLRAIRTPRCLADFNHDGTLDFFDYLDFVDAFAANDPSADFNGDSVIDFFDYLDFVDIFSTGC